MTLAAEAAVLAPDDPDKAVEIFSEILAAILTSQSIIGQKRSPELQSPRVTKVLPINGALGKA